MYVNETDYVSGSANTDGHGLRVQHKQNGVILDLESCHYGIYDIMVGGSSVFGVDASSDCSTLPACLSRGGIDCLNWGIRGAGSQQELHAFLNFKRWVPNIRNVIIFSGVNLCSLATLPSVMIYPDQGALFSEEHYLNQALGGLRSAAEHQIFRDKLARLSRRAINAYCRNSWIRCLLKQFSPKLRNETRSGQIPLRNVTGFSKRVQSLINLLKNELATWASLACGMNFKLTYILQPAINWTRKPLSSVEAECFEEDVRLYPEMLQFANRDFHSSYALMISNICMKNGIRFFDANQCFDISSSSETLFTDVCHLSDQGNEFLAKGLMEALSF